MFLDVLPTLSPFRIATHLNTASAERRRRNMVYGFVGLGTGVAQADAVTMVLANNEIEVPTNSGQFRALLEGYYVFLLAVLGEHSRVVVNYKAHIYNQSHSLQQSLDSTFADERELRGAYLIVMTHIWSCTNERAPGRMPQGPGGTHGSRLRRCSPRTHQRATPIPNGSPPRRSPTAGPSSPGTTRRRKCCTSGRRRPSQG